jgi:peptide/nickel transport system substrate-binding protein
MYNLEKMKGLAAKGKVSRRDFMQFALALGVTVTAAETMFVKAVRSEPKKGGSARFGIAHGAATDTLDPGKYVDTFTQFAFWGALSNSLTVVDEFGKIQPDLAESYESWTAPRSGSIGCARAPRSTTARM